MATKFRIGTIGLYETYQQALDDYNSGVCSFVKKFSKYSCSNSLQYAATPYRDNSFTMRNDKTVVTSKYVPEVSFTFYAMNEEVFQWFIQLTNTTGFYVRYYDYEIGLDVIRYMYMTDQSKDNIQTCAPDEDNQFGFIQNIIGLKISFVSKLAYESYDDLIAKAVSDERMIPRVDTPDFNLSSETVVQTYADANGTTPLKIYAPVVSSGTTTYKQINVVEAGEQITPYDKDGNAITGTIYKKTSDGSFVATQIYYPTLSISCDTEGATLKYSVNSTEDFVSYSTPVSLYSFISNGTTYVRAKASKADMATSYIAKFEWSPVFGG